MAGMDEMLADPETEEALAEFDFLVSETGEGAGEARSQGDGTEWGGLQTPLVSFLLHDLTFTLHVNLKMKIPSKSKLKYAPFLVITEKKDLSPSEEGWGVDQQLISKMKEQYKKERQKGKKGMQSRQIALVLFI